MIAIPQTLRVVYDQHYSQVGASRSTLANHRALLNRWERLTSNPDVREITHRSFEDYRAASISAGLRPDSIESGVRFVRTVLNLAVRVGLREAMPWGGKRLRGRQEPKRVPSLADFGRMYAHVDAAGWPRGMDRQRFWRAVLCVGYWTGLRSSDLFHNLTWGAITEDGIFFTAAKTGKNHAYPMHAVVRRHLDMVTNWDLRRVFPVGRSNKQLLRSFYEISEAAGVKRITPQAIRRLSATQWQRAKWGAGEVIQGSAIRGSAKLYIVPQILQDAATLLEWPAEMLTPEERDQRLRDEALIMERFRRLGEVERQTVLALADRLSS